MKKLLNLSFGLFILIALSGCTKSPSVQPECDALKPILQKQMIGKVILPADVAGIGIEEDIFYSQKNNSCYEGNIVQAEGHQSYVIYKLLLSGTDYTYEMAGDMAKTFFEDDCTLDENTFADGMIQNLTGVKLEKARRESLCTYTETDISKRYQAKKQELAGK